VTFPTVFRHFFVKIYRYTGPFICNQNPFTSIFSLNQRFRPVDPGKMDAGKNPAKSLHWKIESEIAIRNQFPVWAGTNRSTLNRKEDAHG